MPKRHLMIIAGAGASFDSDYERETATVAAGGVQTKGDDFYDLRIPLADELFGRRFQTFRAQYPSLQPLASELNARPKGTSVEEFLGEYQKRAQRDAFVLSQLMAARFYIRDVIEAQEQGWYRGHNHNTNWLSLLSRLRSCVSMNADITIATTNYDRIIEYSLSKFPEFGFNEMSDYIRDDGTNVLKLHGSVDWFKIDTLVQWNENNSSKEWIIANAEKIQEGTDFFKPDSLKKKHQIEGRRLLPAIAIPVREKVDFMCPASVRLRLVERLEAMTHLLVIGWRGEDKHISQLVREHGKNVQHVTLVGRDTDGLISLGANLNYDTTFKEVVDLYDRGFSKFVSGSAALKKLCTLLG